MRKITIESISKELNLKILSNEYKRGRLLEIQCNCGRIFKTYLKQLRINQKCNYCNNLDLFENIKIELISFLNQYNIYVIITDNLLINYNKNKNKTKRQLLKKFNPLEFRKMLILGRIPVNILDQIFYLNSRGLSNYEIYKWIRKENKYRISRSKIDNIIKVK